ncbi:MAG: hypothetical protein LUD76_06685 [Alistipes sp.]|nr:hypothetical protein [Alistipes sp.]
MDYGNKARCWADSVEHVETLLAKYFEGETSLAEERELREFFTSGVEVPDHLKYAEALFGFFAGAAEETGPAGFIPGASVDCQAPNARPSGRREVTPVAGAGIRGGRRLARVATGLVSAAAVVALGVLLFKGQAAVPGVAGDGAMADGSDGPVVYCYVNGVPVTDLDQALAYTEQALNHISGAISSPVEQAAAAFERLADGSAMTHLGTFAAFMEIINE